MNPHSRRQQHTPTWKVNLTQKFNIFSQKKRIANHQIQNFDKQLQDQLNFIPNSKEESQSQKILNIQQKNVNQRMNNQPFNKKNQNCQQKINRKPSFELSPAPGSRVQRLNLNQIDYNEDTQLENHKNSNNLGTHSLFTDQKIGQLFQKYFCDRKSIQLLQFIDMCCVQFYKSQAISPQYKAMLADQCRPLFCTTEQNIISFNAVQLVTKKYELKLLIAQKLLDVKYKKRRGSLQKQYEKILIQIVIQQQAIKLESQKLSKRKKQIQIHQKQLNRKQKNIKNQQKELQQKQKYMKKTLEQKSNKLASQMMLQVEKYFKQVQRKASAFERNARNKIQLIQKRANDIKFTLNRNIPQKDTQQNINRKAHNQILILKNKLKKTEKQSQNFVLQTYQQIKNLQSQSNGLLKANALLESKIQKMKGRNKQLNQIISKKQFQTQQLTTVIKQKEGRINQLQGYILQLQHKVRNEAGFAERNRSFKNDKKSQPKATQLGKKQRKNQQVKSKGTGTKQQQSCKQTVPILNQILKLITTGFKNNKQSILQQNNPSVKMQQVLLNESFQIFKFCSKVIWIAVQNGITQINGILSLMIDVFLAKFSFLKFKAIDLSDRDNIASQCSNSVENLIQKVQIQCLKGRSIQKLFKICASYLQILQGQRDSHNLLNLYLFFSMVGLDQIYSLRKSRSILIVGLMKDLLSRQILRTAEKGHQSADLIARFQEEELMTYLFSKFLAYSSSISEVYIFVQLLLELCNFYAFQNQSIPLFKTMYALNNYKYLFDYVLINFTETNVQNDEKLRQIFQNISIILQRFCYIYGGKVILGQTDTVRLKKLAKKLHKNKQTQDSLFRANVQSILQKINESNQEN